MASEGQTAGNTHVLLIGIDDYPVQALGGCVNDVDLVQRLLLDSDLGIAPESIRRLTAPRAGSDRPPVAPEDLPTFANIRSALAELARPDKVHPGDRVFIFYSGHGLQRTGSDGNGKKFEREALVPVDFLLPDKSYLGLYDYEINEALRKIVERTTSVTVVLDACHAAGAYRDLVNSSSAMRSLDTEKLGPAADAVLPPAPSTTADRGLDGHDAGLGSGIADCHVVVACRADEFAKETTAADGSRHGLLTRAFHTAVKAVPAAQRATLTWGQIWDGLRADVVGNNPAQRPWMQGSLRRAVFAGPPTDGDSGIAVRQAGERYRIDAGTMSEITPGAEIAVYGRDPARFPPRDSAKDVAARLGVIRIDEAEVSSAVGTAVGAPFAVPAGARGRRVKPGASLPLRCAVTPKDPEIARLIEESPLIKLAEAGAGAAPPDVRLELRNGDWLLLEEIEGTEPLVLHTLRAGETTAVRALLEHYHAYATPMRMVKNTRDDLGGQLAIKLLACPDVVPSDQAQSVKLDEIPPDERGTYKLVAKARVCISVENNTTELLQIELFAATGLGDVTRMGSATIPTKEAHRFYVKDTLGVPWQLNVPKDASRTTDRLIAIGKTSKDNPLDHLENTRTFADVVDICLGKKGFGMPDELTPPPPTERWTAVQVVAEISVNQR